MFKSANVGRLDQILRIVVGIALLAAPYFYVSDIWESQPFYYGAHIVGAILILTAFIRFCPLYRIVGMSTCRL